MTDTRNSNQNVLSGWRRAMAVIFGFGLLVPFGVARWLEPDGRGYGTHQQVGLPPCTFRMLTRLPCPSCGGTTAWAYLVRGRLGAALQANAAAVILAVVALAAVPWLWFSATRRRWWGFPPDSAPVAWTLIGIVGIALVQWIYRLVVG